MIELKRFASRTHQGPYLQINEDTFDIDSENGLFMVLDGFGGVSAGDGDVKEIARNIRKFYTKISGDPDSTLPFYYSHKYLLEGNALINSFHYTHRELKKRNLKKDVNFKSGASVAALALSDHLATVCSTGNCRTYLLRDQKLTQIIAEETLESCSFPEIPRFFASAPLSAIGLFDDLHIQTRELRILPKDMILFLTDGVYSCVSDSELESTLNSYGDSLQYKLNNLLSMANEQGNMDNQTLLVLEF